MTTASASPQGRLDWIGVRPARREALRALERVVADHGQGLEGDHYGKRANRRRQVTLLQAEHLPEIAAAVGHPVSPEILRRNLVISGLALATWKGQCLRIGSAILRVTGHCRPCSRMKEALGSEGLAAMRGRGGMTAEIVQGGILAVGDAVLPLQDDLFAAADLDLRNPPAGA